MAQIIKHRRGSILSIKDVSANVGELVIGTGSIDNLSGPVLFVGHTAVNGGYNPVSKIYQGTNAPTISVGSHGSTMDGVPFYSTAAQTLYILDKSGNVSMDLTGNIEGKLISGVTINVVSGNTANYQNISGSFTGSGMGLYDIPASGITGLNLSQIADGAVTASVSSTNGFRVNTNSIVSGSLTVTGSTYTNSDVFITGNTYQTGSINLTGDVVLRGNISIGDSLTGDTVTLNSEISSSLIPSETLSFNLGSNSNQWDELYVDTAYINNINISGISTTNLALPGYLTVSGQTTLSGSVYVQDLTNNRVVIAGSDGLLEDDANFTFDASTLKISDGKFEVDVADGDIRTSGSLLVKNSSTVTGSMNVHGHINLTNEAQIRIVEDTANTIYGFYDGSSIYGSYYQMFGNDYTVASQRGGAEFVFDSTNSGTGGFNIAEYNGTTWLRKLFIDSTTVGFTGSTSVSGDLTVTGNTSLRGNLNVTGTTSISGATVIDDTLRVTGISTLESGLNVSGSTVIDDTLRVTGISTLESGLNVSGATVIDDTLRVTGNSTLEGTLTVTGATSLLSGVTVNGNETVNGVLTVTGNTQLGGNLYVSGNLEVLGSSTNVNLQSTTVEIGDNIILVNAYSPFQRYAGITAYDSGSVGTSGSLLYDSLNDYWIFQNSDATTSKLVGISGTTMGSEASLSSGTIPVAMAGNKIKDSLLGDNGTTLTYNTNKFTVGSSDGATLIAGNVTLSSGGGADSNSKTSAILFRNNSNVLGYVSTTETTDVLDGILGYKNSNGALVFSTVIDGGTYS